MENDSTSTIRTPDAYTYAATGSLVGSIAVLLLVIAGFLLPEGLATIDRAQDIEQLATLLADYHGQALLVMILDIVFVAGYLSLFMGLYLITRDFSTLMAKLAVGLGVLVALLDLVENAILITIIQGTTTGWQPGPEQFATVFILNSLIDILSYVTALLFALIFLLIYRPWDPKYVIGLLLAMYVFVGLASLVNTNILVVRSLVFIVGLGYGTIILLREEEIPMEILEELLDNANRDSSDSFR